MAPEAALSFVHSATFASLGLGTPLDPRNGYGYGRASVQPLHITKRSLRWKLRRIFPVYLN